MLRRICISWFLLRTQLTSWSNHKFTISWWQEGSGVLESFGRYRNDRNFIAMEVDYLLGSGSGKHRVQLALVRIMEWQLRHRDVLCKTVLLYETVDVPWYCRNNSTIFTVTKILKQDSRADTCGSGGVCQITCGYASFLYV